MLSGNSADDACSCWCSCFCSLRSRLRTHRPSSDIHAIVHHGDLSCQDLPAIHPPPLAVVVLFVRLLEPASSRTVPPGARAIRLLPCEIRVCVAFVVSPEVPLKLNSFRGFDWRDLRVELPSSILLLYVEDLFLVDGHLGVLADWRGRQVTRHMYEPWQRKFRSA